MKRLLSLPLAIGLSLAIAGLVLLSSLALAQEPGPSPSPTGKPGQPILIRWSTETEVDTAGFNVYRAESEAGPWQKINDRLIPGSPDPLRGGSYVFTDTQVIAGQTYWYELEEVELGGRTSRLERTQATAISRQVTLPCASGALLLAAAGVVLIRRRRTSAL